MNIYVKHNAEIAHRLSQDDGKCLRIHGHSLQIELHLEGDVDDHGMLAGLNFSDIKKRFRAYIDGEWDHRLHLNISDILIDKFGTGAYPGAKLHSGDPTIEHVVEEIKNWGEENFPNLDVWVKVQETNTNGAYS